LLISQNGKVADFCSWSTAPFCENNENLVFLAKHREEFVEM
jgi:hypothetical protein